MNCHHNLYSYQTTSLYIKIFIFSKFYDKYQKFHNCIYNLNARRVESFDNRIKQALSKIVLLFIIEFKFNLHFLCLAIV